MDIVVDCGILLSFQHFTPSFTYCECYLVVSDER